MKFINSTAMKFLALIATGILFIVPYINNKYSSKLVLVLSGVTLTIYIISAVLEQRRKSGQW